MKKTEPIIAFEKELEKYGIHFENEAGYFETQDFIADLLRKQHEHTLSLVKLERIQTGVQLDPKTGWLKANQQHVGYNQAVDHLEQLKEKLL